MTTTAEGKVEKLAKYLDINAGEIRQLLGLSITIDVTTFDEAETVYDRSPDGSELEKAALAKITMIGTKVLDEATTLDEARKVYDNSPTGSDLKKAALAKMLELI